MKLFATVALLLCLSFSAAIAQSTKYISLAQERVGYAPSSFYISDVADDRNDKTNDGTLTNGAGDRSRVMFTNGLATSLKTFIADNVLQDKRNQAVVLHIVGFNATIKNEGADSHIDVTVTFAFYAVDKKATEYIEHGQATLNTDAGEYVEKFLRQTLESDMKAFDTWWQRNGGKIATKQGVKVNVTISKTTDKPNSIVYSAKRLLQISDFMGPVEGTELEMAATMSGIDMSYVAKTKDGQLVLDVTITPNFDKSRSWFKEEGKTAYVLAHEQAHMDITAIKACELANTIRKTVFTQENYEKLLNELEDQNARAANNEEDKYDSETNHGIIQDKQIMWQNAVKEQVRSVGCY